MRVLVVNPAEYGYTEWITRMLSPVAPRIATLYKKQGHDVLIYDLRPELIECKSRRARYADFDSCEAKKSEGRALLGKEYTVWNCMNLWQVKDGMLYYKDEPILQYLGERRCGNWENEHISRALVRIGRPISSYIQKLQEFKPDLVVVSQVFTYLWEGVKEIIDNTRIYFPEAKIHLGGLYPTLCPDHARSLGPDVIITKSVGCPDDFTWVDLSLYEELPCTIGIFTTLGCPNNCGYCAVPLLEGRKQIHRDPMEVLEEIEYYVAHGVSCLELLDSNFLLDFEHHFKIILREIIRRGIKVKIKSYGGVEGPLLTTEILQLMADAGFVNINVPIESTSRELLSRWGRTQQVALWRRQIPNVHHIIDIKSFMMIGCIDQTIEDIQETIKIVEDVGVQPIALPFTPIPRTREFRVAISKLKGDWGLEDLHPLLFPMASERMTVRQLYGILSNYENQTLNRYGVSWTGLIESEGVLV